jgi:hypothetical protein
VQKTASFSIFAIKLFYMELFSRYSFSPGLIILLTFLLAVLGFVLFLALGILVSALLTNNWELATLVNSDINSSNGLMVMRILQMFQTIGVFIFPSLVVALLVSRQPYKELGFNRINQGLLLLSIVFMIIALPGINLIASLNAEIPMPTWMVEMEKASEVLTKAFLITDNFSLFALNLLMVGILPAIGEELFFRGVLQKYLCKMTRNTFWGVLITALIFSAIHMQFQGFVPRFLLGMIFGYLYVWTRSIWVPIIVHFVNNGLATFAYYIIGKGIIPAESETLGGLTEFWQLGVASIFISSLLLWLIWRGSITSE